MKPLSGFWITGTVSEQEMTVENNNHLNDIAENQPNHSAYVQYQTLRFKSDKAKLIRLRLRQELSRREVNLKEGYLIE